MKVLRDSFLKVPRLKVALGDPMLSADKQFRLLHVACGKAKELTPLMYVLSVLFVLKYIFL